MLRTPRPATEPRDGPTWNLHEKHRKKYPPGRNSGTTRKYPQSTEKDIFSILGVFFSKWQNLSQRAPNPPEFAHPRLSRVKGRSSPAIGYKFRCVCSYMASHYVGVRWHRPYRNKHTQICTSRWGWLPFDLGSGGFGARWKSAPFERALCSCDSAAPLRNSLLFVITLFKGLSAPIIWGGEGKEAWKRGGVRWSGSAQNWPSSPKLAWNRVHIWKVHVCQLLITAPDPAIEVAIAAAKIRETKDTVRVFG